MYLFWRSKITISEDMTYGFTWHASFTQQNIFFSCIHIVRCLHCNNLNILDPISQDLILYPFNSTTMAYFWNKFVLLSFWFSHLSCERRIIEGNIIFLLLKKSLNFCALEIVVILTLRYGILLCSIIIPSFGLKIIITRIFECRMRSIC